MGWIWTALLNGGLGVASYLVARFGFRQPPGIGRALAAAVLGWAWLTIGVELLGVFGALSLAPVAGWVALGLLIGLACRIFQREAHASALPSPPEPAWTWDEVVALALLLWVLAWYWGPGIVGPVEVVSDGPIYHLYLAARWWKSGRLDLIATPFGENAATYFPAVGDLWFTWLFIGLGGDTLAKVGQLPFLALAWLTTFAAARRLGATRPSASLASSWFITSTPFVLFSFVPNVDTIFVAGYLLSAYFFLRFSLADEPPSLILAAIAGGLALGTKATSVVFVPPLLVLGAALAIAKGQGFGRKIANTLVVVVLPFSVCGFFYFRNALLTGNPLYPLHFEAFGRVWLAGWYGPDVMRTSRFYLPLNFWRGLLDTILAVIDPRLAPFWLAALAGAWTWGRRPRIAQYRWVWAASILSFVNIAAYWLLIPYRTQQRFMLQAVGLAVVPLALMLDRARTIRIAALALLCIHLLTAQNWPFPDAEPLWDFTSAIPNNVMGLLPFPARLADFKALSTDRWAQTRVGIIVVEALAAFAVAWAIARAKTLPTRRHRVRAGALAIALLVGTPLIMNPWGTDSRLFFYPHFREYDIAWRAFDQRCGPAGLRVAYAGNGLPYYLLGNGLRNEVRYINIDAHRDWLLHDYHLDASAKQSSPATWNDSRPGWDRLHPDYDAWLANLRAEGIQLLWLTKANPMEGPHNIADSEGFTIERVWADAHPETFELLYGEVERDPEVRIFRVKPAPHPG